MSRSKDLLIPDKIEGYSQVRLDVDLTEGTIKRSNLTNKFCANWIGGYGFGAKILWDELKPGIDPLSPENVFVYTHGPFPTTILPTSSKYGVFAKSPLTGIFGMSFSSGSVGAQARRAGIDMLVIKGKAPQLSYLVINDNDYYNNGFWNVIRSLDRDKTRSKNP